MDLSFRQASCDAVSCQRTLRLENYLEGQKLVEAYHVGYIRVALGVHLDTFLFGCMSQ